MTRDLLKQALEALEANRAYWFEKKQAVDALRERLAQPEQEPVAWVTGWHDGHCVIRAANPAAILPIGVALYTTPPRREWASMTEEEIKALPQWFPSHETAAVMPLIRAIEAKLKEKNENRN